MNKELSTSGPLMSLYESLLRLERQRFESEIHRICNSEIRHLQLSWKSSFSFRNLQMLNGFKDSGENRLENGSDEVNIDDNSGIASGKGVNGVGIDFRRLSKQFVIRLPIGRTYEVPTQVFQALNPFITLSKIIRYACHIFLNAFVDYGLNI